MHNNLHFKGTVTFLTLPLLVSLVFFGCVVPVGYRNLVYHFRKVSYDDRRANKNTRYCNKTQETTASALSIPSR